MISVGIEDMNIFGGTAYLDVEKLAQYRKLDNKRFANLLMKEKSVALPYEDPVSFAVNAAKPIVESLSEQDKDRIELLITCTESGIDFGKSLSTYVHHYLGLSRKCRLFELKNACYSGTAGFQMAINFILSQTSPGAKALVVATDISRFIVEEGGDVLNNDWHFAEPSVGAGAVAMLISEKPNIFEIDVGASGYYGYEIMDTCRPTPDSEAANADLSLLSYLDCCEKTYINYSKKVKNADYQKSFQYLSFHMPFGGMVKGAHRSMMKKIMKSKADEIDTDFNDRVWPGMIYCQRVGNIMGGTLYLSIASAIDNGKYDTPKRIGCFSYGSGCCSEFYSGVVTNNGKIKLARRMIQKKLDERYEMSIEQYENMIYKSSIVRFGTRNANVGIEIFPEPIKEMKMEKRLYLKVIKEFHREYEWI